MAKGNQKYERQATEREQARSQGEYDSFLNQFLGRSGTPQSVAPNTSLSKKGGFGSILAGRTNNTGASSGTAGARDGAGGLTHSTRYEELQNRGDEERDYMRTGLRGMAETGGMGEEGINDFRSRYQGAIGSANQAKLSDFTEERDRYRNFADTGGYTPGDIQRVQAQAARSAPSFYNALRDQQGLAASRMGANAGAGAGMDLKLARQAAQGSAADKLGANIGLAESQREGKKFGMTGLESTQTEMGRQSLEQAGLNNQFQLGAGNITAGAEGDILGLKQKGQLAGYGGLMDLYGSTYAPQSDFEKTWMGAVGDSSKSTQANRGLQLQNDEVNRSRMMENIIGMTGAVGGAMTGLGGLSGMMGGGAKTPSTNLPMNNNPATSYFGSGAFNPMQAAPPPYQYMNMNNQGYANNMGWRG